MRWTRQFPTSRGYGTVWSGLALSLLLKTEVGVLVEQGVRADRVGYAGTLQAMHSLLPSGSRR